MFYQTVWDTCRADVACLFVIEHHTFLPESSRLVRKDDILSFFSLTLFEDASFFSTAASFSFSNDCSSSMKMKLDRVSKLHVCVRYAFSSKLGTLSMVMLAVKLP